MTKPLENPSLWQVLAPVLDESVLQSLRDCDDPDAERDRHDTERIIEYNKVLHDLANWFGLTEVVPPLPEYPEHWEIVKWAQQQMIQKTRQLILSELINPQQP